MTAGKRRVLLGEIVGVGVNVDETGRDHAPPDVDVLRRAQPGETSGLADAKDAETRWKIQKTVTISTKPRVIPISGERTMKLSVLIQPAALSTVCTLVGPKCQMNDAIAAPA